MSKKFIQLKAKWTAKSITLPLQIVSQKAEKQTILALHYIGQSFIRDARDKGTYHDRTGNLRSSIGYAIFSNGKEVGSKFEVAEKDKNGDGVRTAKRLSKEKASKKGLCLVVTAGMEYASAVESRGYNVLTIYAPSNNQVERDLKKLLKHVKI